MKSQNFNHEIFDFRQSHKIFFAELFLLYTLTNDFQDHVPLVSATALIVCFHFFCVVVVVVVYL